MTAQTATRLPPAAPPVQQTNTSTVHKGRRWRCDVQGSRIRYPWPSMRVDDYFDIALARVNRQTVASSASRYQASHRGVWFETTTLINAEGVPVTRVTRVRRKE